MYYTAILHQTPINDIPDDTTHLTIRQEYQISPESFADFDLLELELNKQEEIEDFSASTASLLAILAYAHKLPKLTTLKIGINLDKLAIDNITLILTKLPQQIKELDLSFTNFARKIPAKKLYSLCLQFPPKLISLNLGNNTFYNAANTSLPVSIQIIRKLIAIILALPSNRLKHLYLPACLNHNQCPYNLNGLLPLLATIKDKFNLETLDLSANCLASLDLNVLTQALQKFNAKLIKLSHNAFGILDDNELAQLFASLANSQANNIDLRHNGFGAIAQSLAPITDSKLNLNLSENNDLHKLNTTQIKDIIAKLPNKANELILDFHLFIKASNLWENSSPMLNKLQLICTKPLSAEDRKEFYELLVGAPATIKIIELDSIIQIYTNKKYNLALYFDQEQIEELARKGWFMHFNNHTFAKYSAFNHELIKQKTLKFSDSLSSKNPSSKNPSSKNPSSKNLSSKDPSSKDPLINIDLSRAGIMQHISKYLTPSDAIKLSIAACDLPKGHLLKHRS